MAQETRVRSESEKAANRDRMFYGRCALYGISKEQADLAQALGCESCGGYNSDGRRLALDHDHDTEEFRGWLCRKCNTALGFLNDDLERILALGVYLETRAQ